MRKVYLEISVLVFFLVFYLLSDYIYRSFLYVQNDSVVSQDVYDALLEDYNELLNHINITTDINLDVIHTKVLYRDPLALLSTVTILSGSSDGIEENSAVINSLGFVGVIETVTENTSTVRLLGNTDTSLSVSVGGSYGVLKYVDGKLIIDSITTKETIEKDTLVYTSGFTNIPGGLLVGKVEEVIDNDLGIEKTIIVEPVVNFGDINYLMVVKNGDNS